MPISQSSARVQIGGGSVERDMGFPSTVASEERVDPVQDGHGAAPAPGSGVQGILPGCRYESLGANLSPAEGPGLVQVATGVLQELYCRPVEPSPLVEFGRLGGLEGPKDPDGWRRGRTPPVPRVRLRDLDALGIARGIRVPLQLDPEIEVLLEFPNTPLLAAVEADEPGVRKGERARVVPLMERTPSAPPAVVPADPIKDLGDGHVGPAG